MIKPLRHPIADIHILLELVDVLLKNTSIENQRDYDVVDSVTGKAVSMTTYQEWDLKYKISRVKPLLNFTNHRGLCDRLQSYFSKPTPVYNLDDKAIDLFKRTAMTEEHYNITLEYEEVYNQNIYMLCLFDVIGYYWDDFDVNFMMMFRPHDKLLSKGKNWSKVYNRAMRELTYITQ